MRGSVLLDFIKQTGEKDKMQGFAKHLIFSLISLISNSIKKAHECNIILLSCSCIKSSY